MAEKSILWTTGATGDGASPYTQAESIRWRRQEMVGDDALEGVLKGYENDLEVTGAVTPIQINTGAAIVYGFPYWNTAAVNKTISTPAGNTRFDRVVLQADWTAQTIRIAVLGGVEGAGTPPAVTQTDGVTWEITLATFSITTGGTITVTDARSFLHPNIAVDENMIDAAVAGDGLAGGDGSVLSVNVDDATIEISADTLQVKDAGIDSDAIASSIAGDGLQGGSGSALAVDVSDFAGDGLVDDGSENLDVNVDDSTIEIDTDVVQLKASGHGPSEHADRTRKFFVVAEVGVDTTGGDPIAPGPDGVSLSHVDTYPKATGHFFVPEDYVSGMTMAPVLRSSGAGNVSMRDRAYIGADGEDYDTHNPSQGFTLRAVAAPAVGAWENNITAALTLTGVAKSDIVTCETQREVSSDSYTDGLLCVGWIISYTADQ